MYIHIKVVLCYTIIVIITHTFLQLHCTAKYVACPIKPNVCTIKQDTWSTKCTKDGKSSTFLTHINVPYIVLLNLVRSAYELFSTHSSIWFMYRMSRRCTPNRRRTSRSSSKRTRQSTRGATTSCFADIAGPVILRDVTADDDLDTDEMVSTSRLLADRLCATRLFAP